MKTELERLWVDYVQSLDRDGVLFYPVAHFPMGTRRDVVDRWFAQQYPGGLDALREIF